MSLLDRLLHRKPDPRGTMLPLYQAVVHRGRAAMVAARAAALMRDAQAPRSGETR